MSETPTGLGRIITFYSYKGGTGRSMGVANVAWVLALSGFKVLVIDWDLEAPGLHRYFRPFLADADLSASDGVIDFVIHFAEAASEQTEDPPSPDWYKAYSNLVRYAKQLDYEFPQEGTLDFIPAGRQNSAYAGRVNSFNWKHFYEKLNGGKVLEQARVMMREEYDYILIDSRTGVSDTAGICTVQMPDELVVCFTLNLQSVIGASAAATSVVEQRERGGQPIRVLPIPMRVELNEKLKTSIMKEFAKPKFLALLPTAMTEEQKDKYWGESDVPYIPFYAFEENLAYFRDDLNSLTSLLGAMRRIARRLTSGDWTSGEMRDLPKLDPKVREEIVAAYDAFSATKTARAVLERSQTTVLISADSHESAADLRSALNAAGLEGVTNERAGDEAAQREGVRRAAAFLIVIGETGFTAQQREELLAVETARSALDGSRVTILTVLLPGAQPELLPRLLLRYAVVDMRDGGDPAPRVKAQLDRASTEPVDHLPVCPYPGLYPFAEDDYPVFSGRDALSVRLAGAVTRSRFVALVGPAGAGKESLVQAGLVPRLKRQEPPSAAWEVRFGVPPATPSPAERTPRSPLARVLLVLDAPVFAEYVQQLRPAPRATAVHAQQSGWNLAVGGDPITCVLIIAESAEQVASCERAVAGVAERIEIPPLSEAELVVAVTGPAVCAGLPVDAALAKRLAAELKDERDQLPLLQYVLAELWARDPQGSLTVAKYEAMGGIQVVERTCEATFARLAPDQQSRCLRALTRLIFVAEGGSLTPQSAPEASFGSDDKAGLEAFLSAGVLRRESDESSQAHSWRFSDRIFIERWPRFQQFVERTREFLFWRQRLGKSLSAWQSHRTSLLDAHQLAEAQSQAAEHPDELNKQEREYIELSSATIKANEQQAKKQIKENIFENIKMYWSVAVVAALAVGGYYFLNNYQKWIRTQAWCYQRQLPNGYGAYCYAVQADCTEKAIVDSLKASQCVLIDKQQGLWEGRFPWRLEGGRAPEAPVSAATGIHSDERVSEQACGACAELFTSTDKKG